MIGDKHDERIIEELRRDSRVSLVEIGQKCGLSDSAVRRRVKSMMDRGVIKRFTVEITDAGATKAIVLVSVDSASDTSEVSETLAKLRDITTVYEITGQYDIAVIMSASNIADINRSIDELRKIPGVIDSNTVIILRTLA